MKNETFSTQKVSEGSDRDVMEKGDVILFEPAATHRGFVLFDEGGVTWAIQQTDPSGASGTA